MRRASVILATMVVVLGCAPTVATEGDAAARALAISSERLQAIDVTLTIDRAVAAPGQTVEFTAAATNRGATRVQIGVQCGPAFDVVIAAPGGDERSALADQLGPNGVFTCVLLPEHFVDPGSTQTARIAWVVPAIPGSYDAVAGLRRDDGLANPSAPVRILVR